MIGEAYNDQRVLRGVDAAVRWLRENSSRSGCENDIHAARNQLRETFVEFFLTETARASTESELRGRFQRAQNLTGTMDILSKELRTFDIFAELSDENIVAEEDFVSWKNQILDAISLMQKITANDLAIAAPTKDLLRETSRKARANPATDDLIWGLFLIFCACESCDPASTPVADTYKANARSAGGKAANFIQIAYSAFFDGKQQLNTKRIAERVSARRQNTRFGGINDLQKA